MSDFTHTPNSKGDDPNLVTPIPRRNKRDRVGSGKCNMTPLLPPECVMTGFVLATATHLQPHLLSQMTIPMTPKNCVRIQTYFSPTSHWETNLLRLSLHLIWTLSPKPPMMWMYCFFSTYGPGRTHLASQFVSPNGSPFVLSTKSHALLCWLM